MRGNNKYRLQYTNWGINQPKTFDGTNDNTECVFANADSLSWAITTCAVQEKHQVLCKKMKLTNPPQEPYNREDAVEKRQAYLKKSN